VSVRTRVCTNIYSRCNVLVELMYAQQYYTDYVDYIDFIRISYDNYTFFQTNIF